MEPREALDRLLTGADRAAHVWWPTFTCPACRTATRHPNDVEAKYCARCHWWTGDPALAFARPDLFEAHGRTPPPIPGPAVAV